MFFFRSNPFIRLLIPLVLGIILQQYFTFPNTFLLSLCIAFLIIDFLLYINNKSYTRQWYFGIGIMGFLLCAAIFFSSKTDNPKEDFFNRKQQLIQAITSDIPKETANSYSVPVHINAIRLANTWVKQDFETLVYFEKDSSVANLEAGQKLVVKIRIDSIQSNLNPFGFDYASYMSFNQVNHTAFIKSKDWMIIHDQNNSIKSIALNLRQKIIHIYEMNGIENDELAVFSALTIGYKNKLDSQVKQAYAGAGAMHILAVSGMHVAIILGILNFLFKGLGLINSKSRFPYLVILIFIWAYAFITGLSPSISRASVMVTFMLFGKVIGKRINIYNSLAAAAFFMLCYNPYYLFQVGFQLSFIAVLSIVVFYKRIYNLIYCKNKILNMLWQLTAVSIAAQIGTLPLGIYYFNQLPLYFWLSGAFTVFAAQILMVSAIVLVVLGSFGLHYAILGDFVSFITRNLNKLIFEIYELPHSIIPYFNHSVLQVVLLFALIISSWAWLVTKKKNWFFASLSCILFLVGVNSFNKITATQFNKLAVYHVNKKTAIQLIQNNASIWMTTDTTDMQLNRLLKDAGNYWQIPLYKHQCLLTNKDIIFKTGAITIKDNWVQIGSKTAFVIDKDVKLPVSIIQKLPIDYLIITQNPSYTLSDIDKIFNYKKIIVDASVSRWKYKKWQSKIVSTHFVTKHGAFIESFHN